MGSSMVTVVLQINHARLQKRLSDLATIGQLSSGGVRRTAYSLEDLAARQQVIAAMEAIDLYITMRAPHLWICARMPSMQLRCW